MNSEINVSAEILAFLNLSLATSVFVKCATTTKKEESKFWQELGDMHCAAVKSNRFAAACVDHLK